MPAELFISISIFTARSSPASILTSSIAAAESAWIPNWPALDRQAGAALGHVERVGDPDHSRLERVGLAAAAVADDRVQDLGDHHGPLGLLVDAGEQRLQALLDQEQAVGLVVGAVDRHADVVEQRAARDHDLGVAVAHAVVGDHRRLDPALAPAAEAVAARC